MFQKWIILEFKLKKFKLLNSNGRCPWVRITAVGIFALRSSKLSKTACHQRYYTTPVIIYKSYVITIIIVIIIYYCRGRYSPLSRGRATYAAFSDKIWSRVHG